MKISKILPIMAIAILLLSAIATASMLIPANDRAKENAKAPEKSPTIGDSWDIERVDFVHYAKPAKAQGPSGTNTCYKLMGVKWNTLPVSYVINPTNQQGLTEEFITSALSASAETWDAATSKDLFSDTFAVSYGVQYGVRDYTNALAFGDYPDSNVIAVTSVWYSRATKQIVEFDQEYNTRFAWGDASINPSLMDLQNIATHELGHAVGLADIYTSSCSSVTMYGYSGNGDLQKRTLEQPDLTGLQKMYGA